MRAAGVLAKGRMFDMPAVDNDRYKVVFRSADLRNVSVRSPQMRTIAHHGRRIAPAAVNATSQTQYTSILLRWDELL